MARVFRLKMDLSLFKKEFCSVYMFLLTFFNAFVNTHMTVGDNSHAFIQANNNDVRLMGVQDGLEVLMHQDVHISNLHEDLRFDDDAFATSTYLKFVPPQLDFKERHLGVPHQEKVTLINTNPNRTIHLTSISANTLHFHSSFFQDKTIPPKGNTTFSVVLLARVEGFLSSSLYVDSSEGLFRYHVTGIGVESPYRLRPVCGLQLPLNAIFQPLVMLHNPHSHPIQVVEVYSSGRDVHLELPDGEQEGPKALWEIPPFFTKPVIRAKFEAVVQANHTSYIRMKLKHSKEMLVVPVEVEVTEQGGLYPVESYIDFGMDGTGHPARTFPLQLSNSLKRAVRIVGIGLATPNKAISIGFEPIRVPPTAEPVTVANLTFDWKVAFEIRQASGHIWIKTRGSTNKLMIPYTATVYEGSLKFNPATTQLLTLDLNQLPRPVTVVNQYRIPLAINNATLLPDATKVFQIKGFEQKILPPGKSIDILTFGLRDGCTELCREQRIDSSLILSTNISEVVIPVRIYDGRYNLLFPHEGAEPGIVDLGLLSAGKVHTFRFGLHNHNPVPIELKAVGSDTSAVRPQILGIFKGNTTAFKTSYLYGNITDARIVPPDGVAVVQLRASLPNAEQTLFHSRLDITTAYLIFPIRVKATIATGSLEMIPKDLVLEDCFPGKICKHQLKVQSSFNRPMTAVGVTTVPPDPRLTFKGNPGGSDILPSTSNYIGELTWEPWRACGASCYLGLPLNSTGGSQWVYSSVLPPSLADSDANLLKERYQRLANLTNSGSSEHWENITLRLHTNELREQLFKARVRLTWPKLANVTKLVFPLTQVTNTTLLRLKLFNPASHLILVQLVMEWAYPQPKRLIDSFPASFRPQCGKECFQSTPKEFFIFQDFSDSAGPLGVLNTTLAPGESYEITIGFNPRNPGPGKSLLFIRNNLTVIETLELEGRAAYAQFKFGNRRPGAENPLMFEIVDKHLRDCYSDRNKKYSSPNLTVKRSFTARNVGDLPIYVHGFSISGLECEGYGFAVLNCAPFLLLPNSTRKIDIAFTPDFTLSKVTRTLRLATTVGTDVNYTMVTTLPSYFLSSCATVLGRPSWEPLLYYSAVSFMLFLLFCVLAAAYFESDRIMKCALLTMSRDRTAIPLDLRQVGAGVLKELASNRKMDSDGLDSMEKYKLKDPSPVTVSDTPGWITGLCADDRQFEQPSKESATVKCDDGKEETPPKPKKKLGKRNSDADAQEVAAISKRKEKNTSNGWCNVFNRSAEKAKPKMQETPPPEPVKPVKPVAEIKREDVKKEDKEKRRSKVKRSKEAEEDASSNMTDSSNDAEKDGKETNKENKEEKKPKVIYKPKPKDESNSDEIKAVHSRTIWRMGGAKSAKSSIIDSVSVWKQPEIEPEPLRTIEISKSRGKNNNVRERKEKAIPRRSNDTHSAFHDFPMSNTLDIPCPPPPPSCWEQRTFSNVVAKDTPLLYSNIVSSKPSASHMFSDSKPEGSAPLGPIGSNKPTSVWGNSSMATQKQYGFANNSYLGMQPEPEPLLDPEDALPLDPEDHWEDQHALMQMMHAQTSWKAENWPSKSVWSSELNSQPTAELQDQSWGSLLRSSWGQQWGLPHTSSLLHSLQNQHHHDYPQDYGTDSILYAPPPTQPTEDPHQNGAQFDPFHSLGSIWSPKAPNTWSAPGTQMDSVYPEPLSRLYRRTVRKKVHKANPARYRTQPVTFSEIQEVDEENVDDGERSAGSMSKSEMDLKAKFEEFKRKRDRDFRDSILGPPAESVIQKDESSHDSKTQSSSRAIPVPRAVTNLQNSYPRPSL